MLSEYADEYLEHSAHPEAQATDHSSVWSADQFIDKRTSADCNGVD